MSEELVSIIIPLYNKKKYIKETIENIKNQTYKNWELLIVDDCSNDGSYEIAKSYQSNKIHVLRNNKNSGPAITRNIGLEHARGRFICYQDADDLWEESKTEKQVEFMKNENCAFSYTAFKYMKNGGTKAVKVQPQLKYKEALKDTRILANAIMFDMNKIDKKLLEMPNVGAEDIATWWNILKNGYTAYGIEEPLVYYRQIKNSASSNKIKSARSRWKLYRDYEKISFIKSLYYFMYYVFFAVVKRI